jgi:hypothetical protein
VVGGGIDTIAGLEYDWFHDAPLFWVRPAAFSSLASSSVGNSGASNFTFSMVDNCEQARDDIDQSDEELTTRASSDFPVLATTLVEKSGEGNDVFFHEIVQ